MRASIWGWALALGLCAQAQAAGSLVDLYQAVPPPPGELEIARAGVSAGRLSAPEVLGYEARLRAERAPEPAAAPSSSTSATRQAAAIAQVVASEKAYASAHAGDQSPAAALGARVQWLATRFSGLNRRVAGTEREAEVRGQELSAYGALFQDWRAQRAPLISRAQYELAAVGDPAAIASDPDRAAVQRYRAAMLDEVEVLLGLTRFAIERAAGLPAAEPAQLKPSANTLWELMSDPRRGAAR